MIGKTGTLLLGLLLMEINIKGAEKICKSLQGPRNSGAEGARAPPLFCSNNVSNKKSKRYVKNINVTKRRSQWK